MHENIAVYFVMELKSALILSVAHMHRADLTEAFYLRSFLLNLQVIAGRSGRLEMLQTKGSREQFGYHRFKILE